MVMLGLCSMMPAIDYKLNSLYKILIFILVWFCQKAQYVDLRPMHAFSFLHLKLVMFRKAIKLWDFFDELCYFQWSVLALGVLNSSLTCRPSRQILQTKSILQIVRKFMKVIDILYVRQAANPGCILEDFVRWHSPPDWTEGEPSDEAQEYVDQVDSSSTRGQLSSRMQKEGLPFTLVTSTTIQKCSFSKAISRLILKDITASYCMFLCKMYFT